MSFNDAQIQAMNHLQGPALVLAGPGSGKTTVITQRIRHLIEEEHVAPEHILVITFTRMAAREMQTRFQAMEGCASYRVTFGTFHAVYFTMLKHGCHLTARNIIRQDQQLSYIKETLAQFELEIVDLNEYTQQLLSEIGKIKNDRLNPLEFHSSICPDQIFQTVYQGLQAMMEQRRLIDFDDMMLRCDQMLVQRPELLAAWRNKYQYIMIDEFQDICKAQFDVIQRLAEPKRNLFIVGDDDQSIYGFRGSRPDIMLGFSKIYDQCVRIDLSQNYRSTEMIVACAQSLIRHNQNRFEKELRAQKSGGALIQVYEFTELEKENDFILEQIGEWLNKGGKLSQCAVLSRTNAGAEVFLRKLVERDIKFKAREQLKNLFSHWIADDILCYIRIALGSHKRSEFLRIMNKPLRYLKRDSMPEAYVSLSQIRSYYSEKEWMLERIDQLQFDLKMLSGLNPFAGINYIRKGIGYEEYLQSYAREYRVNYEELQETLEQIHQTAGNYRTYQEWFQFIEQYSLEIEQHNGQLSDTSQAKEDAINICTLHSCKGLEFEQVFILDVNEGIMPYHKAVLEAEIEEERRMFYVAMTRAKSMLYLCFVNQRFNKKVQKSRFLEEMDARYVAYHEAVKES